MRPHIRQLFGAVLTFLALSACGAATTDRAGSLAVVQNGGVLSRLTLSQLTALPQAEIATPQSRGAQVQKGPTVRSVLWPPEPPTSNGCAWRAAIQPRRLAPRS